MKITVHLALRVWETATRGILLSENPACCKECVHVSTGKQKF